MEAILENVKKSEALKVIRGARPYFSDTDINDILSDVKGVLETGNLMLGPYTAKLEEKFASYVGTKYAVATSSCTSALEIAMRFFELRSSEVIVPTNTFIACPNSVIFAGGRPVFSDIDPQTYCTTLENVIKKQSNKTRGVMAVHLGGLPLNDIRAMHELCEKKEMFLIEDCSHAHGAMIDGAKVGSIGDVGCFSLMATKVITSGLGGMLVTNNKDIYEYALETRNSASGRVSPIRRIASDWMMSEVTAAIGVRQFDNLEKILEVRRAIAQRYKEGLSNLKNVTFYEPPSNVRQTYYKFLATLGKGADKAKVISEAKSVGIEIGSLYETPCHMHPLYQNMGYKIGECPVAEESLKHQIALPVHVKITDEDTELINQFMKERIG